MGRQVFRLGWAVALGAPLVLAEEAGQEPVEAAPSLPEEGGSPASQEDGSTATEQEPPDPVMESEEPAAAVADDGLVAEEEEPPPVESVTDLDQGSSLEDGSSTEEEFPEVEEPTLRSPPKAGPFAGGNIRLGASIGWASSFGAGESVSWFILGAGAGYFVVNGLEVHGDVTTWIGDPFIATLTPGVRYVFYQVPAVKPYVGLMYRHYFLSAGYPDTDSVGGRVGLNFMISPKSYFGGGVLIEHFLDQNVWSETPQVYPEIVLSLML